MVAGAAYPGTNVLSPFHSLASLLLVKRSRTGRAANAFPLGADPGLGLMVGLNAVPKATHLTSYSERVRRSSNVALLQGLARQCRQIGLCTGEAGFNLDFHTIGHHGDQVPLEEHYVASRSQPTRSVLTFFAQDHSSTEIVYANADLTKADQAGEVIAFADYWKAVAGSEPGLLVFDSKVTIYKTLDELAARGITFLTLRARGRKLLEALAALPSSAWSTYNLKRAGRYRHPQIHEEIIGLEGIEIPLRQIAVRNIGHEHPTLLITNDLATAAKDLFGRYAERTPIENELDADISGFGLNALASGLPLNVDLDTTLTVLAGNAYRLLARKLPRYEQATPRPALASLPRQHRQDRRRTRPRQSRPRRAHLHPRPHRRRLPRARPTRPLVGGRTLRFGFPPRRTSTQLSELTLPRIEASR
ncbi:MAG: hypothetical protein M0T80_13790 [Actinomycetota bacterium]|nr:hypothetical protein [Actinomycetota bacterium]